MSERLWGHDAMRIEIPYAVAKIVADRDHPHRSEVLDAISTALGVMLASSNLLDPSPISTVIEGVLADGADLSMGPVAYVRKVFLSDVERSYIELRNEIELEP
jgi:hypothetical protein